MLTKAKQAIYLLAGLAVAPLANAQGLDLTSKTNTFVDTLDSLGLPVLIVAICVSVFGYWFKYVGLAFAGAILIGGVIFGAAPEIAAYILA